MTSRRKWLGSLERRLFLIVVAGLLPLILLSFGTLYQAAQQQRAQLIEAGENRVRAISSAVDAELRASVAAIETLAASPRLARGDLEGFGEEARQVLELRPRWANVVLSSAALQQVFNSRLPRGTPLPRSVDTESIRQTISTRRTVIGNLMLSPVEGYAFAVMVPVSLGGGEVSHALVAVVRPGSINDVLTSQRIPAPGVVALLDRNLRIVSRSQNAEQMMGKEATPALRQLLVDGATSGWGKSTTQEGVQVYTMYARSPVTGWVTALGLPAEALDGPVQRSYAVLGGAIVLSIVIGLLAAFLVARGITRPMRELEREAQRMGQGVRPAVPATQLTEVRRIGSALLEAHREREALSVREREATRQAHEARQVAERANRMKDEFLAMLAHELRNPLAAISSASHLLDMMGSQPDPATAAHAKGVIRRQVGHMSHLVDDLLNVGRVMTGKIDLERTPLDLSGAVGGAVRTLQGTGALDRHRLQLDLQPVWVNADSARLEQVISNLLSNAVKYTPQGGQIEVQLAAERGGGQHSAVLRVKDSGVGIEPELLPHVFDLFVQGKRSLDRSQGGLGIGLTLVRRLTELHGGSVSAYSAGAGQGSEFIVRLPAIEAPAPAHVRERNRTEPGSALTVVLVEDNDDLRGTLRSLLSIRGHQVHEAADGKAGLEAVLRHRPDVALVDIGLPLLDGYGLARAVRSQLPDGVRLIAMTGYGSEDDIEAGLAAGFDGYLIKPVEFDALARLLDED